MSANDPSPGNVKKIQQLQRAIEKGLPQVLKRDFFGNFTIELSIQDGTIQNIRSRVEQIEK